MSWKTISKQKRAQRDKAIARTIQELGRESADDIHYLSATAVEITRHIEQGEWTATRVVEAFIRRAITAQEKTNCITEVLFSQARKEAAALDEEFSRTKQLKGLLHGVPVSFKDQYNITGFDTTIGFTQWANKPQTEDAHLVKQYRAAGAIIIAKTNVPQTMLTFECTNPLWGRTTNPYSEKFTCGGSSGGESALLAMSGSVLGVGSDTGGSLRIPVHYCGIYSLKPAANRVSLAGAETAAPGFEAVRTVAGFMGRSVEDIDLPCRLTFGKHIPEYEETAPVPYQELDLPKKLRFGFYTSDLVVKASPVCKRAVLETVEALRHEGHECVEFEPPCALEAFRVFVGLTSADGYKTLLSHLGSDPQDSVLFLVLLGPRLFSFVHKLAVWLITKFVKDAIYAGVFKESKRRDVAGFHKLVSRRDEVTRRWYELVWNKYKFDGIIAPVQALPALPNDRFKDMSPLVSSTVLFNVVDSPVGIVPVTRVDPAKDQLTEEWTKPNGPGAGSWVLDRSVYRAGNATYDVKAMAGLPVGVQIVGKKWDEEKVLAVMKIVDDALGPRGFGPTATLI